METRAIRESPKTTIVSNDTLIQKGIPRRMIRVLSMFTETGKLDNPQIKQTIEIVN